MSLIENIQNELEYGRSNYLKMEKAFQALLQEIQELGQCRDFYFRPCRATLYLEYYRHYKFYTILELHLSPQGALCFQSWKYENGEHVKVIKTFEEPVSYLSSTACEMICRRLSDLGVYSLEKK